MNILFIANTFLTGFLTLVMALFYFSQRTFPGFRQWTIGGGFIALGFLMIVLRGLLPASLTILVQNSLFPLGAVFYLRGTRRFLGLSEMSYGWFAVPAMSLALNVFFLFLFDSAPWRTLTVSLAFAVPHVLTATLIFRDYSNTRSSFSLLLGGEMILASTVLLIWTIWAFAVPGFQLLSATTVHAAVFISLMVLQVIITLSFLMLNVEQANRELVSAQDALNFSEEKYSKAFHATPDAITISRLTDGRLVDVNEAFSSLTEYSRDEALATSSIALSLWGDQQDREKVVAVLEEKSRIRDQEIRFRTKSGTILNCLYSGEILPLRDEVHILSVVRDISQRKQAEQELKDTLRRFYTILASSPAGLLLVTDDDKVEFANQAMCDLFDIKDAPDSLRGLAAAKMIEKLTRVYENPAEVLPRIKDIVAQNKSIRGEEVAVRGGQTYLVDYIPIVMDGNPYGRLWQHTDITNRKQTEEELRVKTHQLNERVKELHCLLAISKLVEKHDISLDQILRGVVDIIPPSWQYPEIACARVILKDKEFKTENHRVPISKQSAEIIAYGECIGELEVGYLEEAPESDGGPFLKEEGNLINIIAERLGKIVESKQAEAVHKSEMFLQEIVENIPDMVFVKDAEHLSFVRCNRAGEELLGYSREDLLGKNDYDFFPQNQADFFTAKDREVMAAGKLAEILDEEIDTKFKGKRILHTKKIPILGPDGTPKFLLGISRDITEGKRREVWLQESYARYRTILKTAMDGFCLVNEWGRILDVNDAYCEVMGYSCDELIGMNLTELEVIATQEQVWAHLRKILAEGSDCFETVQRRKDGSTVQMGVSAQFLSGEEGKLFLFLRDITDRRRSEKELCEREQMLKSILAASPVGIVHTQDRRIIWANRTWEEMFGFSDEREYLHQPTEIMHCSEVEYEHLRKMLYDNISSGGVSEADSILRRKDGSVFDAHIRISLLDPEDSVKGAISAITDVTESKLADEALRLSEERFRTLFQTSNEAIFLSDGLKLIECNPKALQTFGCKDEKDMVGHTPMEFSPEKQPDGLDSKKQIPKYVQAALDSGPQRFYWRHCRKDGTPFDAEVTINGLILKGKPIFKGASGISPRSNWQVNNWLRVRSVIEPSLRLQWRASGWWTGREEFSKSITPIVRWSVMVVRNLLERALRTWT